MGLTCVTLNVDSIPISRGLGKNVKVAKSAAAKYALRILDC
jgi:dsRNA-specific ribonuclease